MTSFSCAPSDCSSHSNQEETHNHSHHDHTEHAHEHDHEDHGHGHGHGHHHHVPSQFGKAIGLAMLINLLYVAFEVLWGIKTNALALLADACHNFSDILALAAAWLGHALSKRKPTERFSYGMKRATILASVTNAGLLLLVTGGIIWESIICLFHPVAVQGLSASAAAAGGIFVNGIAALLLMKGSKDDLNMRGAFLHMASDAVLAVGVVVSGLLVAWTGFFFLDPLTSLILSIVIVLASWRMLSESINLALDAAPTNINPSEIPETLKSLSGIIDIHHLHIWPISTTETALTVHLVIDDLTKSDQLRLQAGEILRTRYKISHATFQIESAHHAC